MEEGTTKWGVTYTKHVKQKRKVYEDGFLLLLSNNKVLLYDECEQMLDCKFLTKGQTLNSGDSFSFSSFLVDIGDPVCNPSCILLPNPITECDSRLPNQDKFRNSFSANRKPSSAARRTSGINLSPSQKFIREFKKNEELRYSVQRSPTSTTASSHKEWEVLYTTQVTQKAKKYHDGFIRLIICGSQGRQVVLCDSNKTHIDKRFLRKDEVICSGGSLKFEAHLVDIGDAVETNENVANVKTQETRNCKTEQFESDQHRHDYSDENLVSRSQRCQLPAQQNHVRAEHAVGKELKKNEELKYTVQRSPTIIAPSSDKEWEVQYTTQITQKDKKYHDGFIRLIICGSQGRQVVLYDSSKTQIYKRFLKIDEVIRSGESLTFNAYLIDVGDVVRSNENVSDEIRNCKTEQPEIVNLMPKPQRYKLPAQQNHVRAENAVAKGQPQHDVSRNCRDSNFSSLGADQMKHTKTAPSHMPARDAQHILSFLKKPVAEDNIFAAEKFTPNRCPSQTQEVVQIDVDNQAIEGTQPRDPHEEMVTEMLYCNNTAKGASAWTGREGGHPKSEAGNDTSATTQINAGSDSKTEMPVSMAGTLSESPNKRQPLVESVTNIKPQVSVAHGQTRLCQHTRGTGFVDSYPSLSSETKTYQQSGGKISDADSSDMGRTSTTTPRRLFCNWTRMNMTENNLNATNSEATLDCPSFDLGI